MTTGLDACVCRADGLDASSLSCPSNTVLIPLQ